MRVISGSKKGRPLQALPGKSTRPTVDKVKESIFSMIGPYFEGGIGLDLYAGTGGLGIEALSRGMEKIVFVDIDKKAIEVIKQNLAKTDLLDQAEVYKNESRRALKALKKRQLPFDLVLLDPPYTHRNIADEIALLEQFGLLNLGAIIVAETDAQLSLPDLIGPIQKQKEAEYGSARITVYRAPD
ncbi:16S rRNA (guanine(966)-N(2))-methyltransferase RsmD [Ammoniphilus oxalaticus]|uniref:16S rRNA (Guanine(966)-N(2))-methyltransferase RsmD n=1 Tax=Ammoniphilus oxalaticus TaxID=66863 RepID=A0A419SJT5_9BACL|nr:16S rRNA (guanine(966)-N(2))-methyltransferase RsmD [Ammoniphilus oxalaticus]RKD24158.1 16S rRNA (guanine(966)-N(2))-methyltransferase RsmD [Ammoniphilus oxalaticus]